MTKIEVTLDPDTATISVLNDGKGIPVEVHTSEKDPESGRQLYIPELIFGYLLTSSNYDDDEEKVCERPRPRGRSARCNVHDCCCLTRGHGYIRRPLVVVMATVRSCAISFPQSFASRR